MILLIVDDRDYDLYTLLFKEAGLDAYGVHSGQEALKWLRTNDPDALLVDLAMPYMDGLSFIEKLESSRYRLGVISGHEIGILANALLKEAGVERIFRKSNACAIIVKEVLLWLKL